MPIINPNHRNQFKRRANRFFTVNKKHVIFFKNFLQKTTKRLKYWMILVWLLTITTKKGCILKNYIKNSSFNEKVVNFDIKSDKSLNNRSTCGSPSMLLVTEHFCHIQKVNIVTWIKMNGQNWIPQLNIIFFFDNRIK